MADSATEIVTAIVHPAPEEVEAKAKDEVAEAKVESQEESDIEESDEEIVLDEPSDTENYEPKIVEGGEGEKADDDDDDSCSSGEEEDVSVDMVELGGQKFYKLKYEDLEAKKKEIEQSMKEEAEKEGESQEEEKEGGESQEDEGNAAKESSAPSAAFKEYRTATIMDEDMNEDYNSEEDEPYNPIHSDLSDIEYTEADEHDTEDEIETEPMEGTHKKTGESLICLKMIEQLKMPPRDQTCSSSETATIKPSDQPMECT